MAGSTPRFRYLQVVGEEHYFAPFGLNDYELATIREYYTQIEPPRNGEITTQPSIKVINILASLGYRLVAMTQKHDSNKVIWMLERPL